MFSMENEGGYDNISVADLPFNAELDAEQIIRSSRLFNSVIDTNIFSQITGTENETSKVSIEKDTLAHYENIDDFCQVMELIKVRYILASKNS